MRQSLITATAASSLVACWLMGALANLPLAVAPGMGERLACFLGLFLRGTENKSICPPALPACNA